jgi:excisionase family DNA binding protein
VKALADRLAVTPMTIYRLVGQGKLPAVKIGRAIRFDPDAVAAYPDSPPGEIAPGKANRRTALNGRPARATQGHPAEPVGVAQTEPPQ